MIIDQKNGFSSPNYGLTVDMENFWDSRNSLCLDLWGGFLGICILEFYRPAVLLTHTTHAFLVTAQPCVLCFVSERVLTMALLLWVRVLVFVDCCYVSTLKQQIPSHVLSLLCRSLHRAAGAFLQYGSKLSQRAKKRPPCPTSWGHFTFSILYS